MMFNYDKYFIVVLLPLTDSCSSFFTSVLEHLRRRLPLAHDSCYPGFFRTPFVHDVPKNTPCM
jgi:hypothetical protein